MAVSDYGKVGDVRYDQVTDSLYYREQRVLDHIRREAEAMVARGVPDAVVQEYVAEMMSIERRQQNHQQPALDRIAREFSELMRPAPLRPPQQPTHRKELLCLL
jgi:hypothetical protein